MPGDPAIQGMEALATATEGDIRMAIDESFTESLGIITGLGSDPWAV